MWRCLLLILSSFMVTFRAEKVYSLNSTFNLVKHLKSITASNTCGEDASELYCLLTGTPLAPGLDYTYSRYPGEYIDGQFCNTCDPGQHSIENAVDDNEENWWQSSSLAVISDYNQQMTIDLDLGQEYQAVYFVLKAANSPRPARWVLEKSTDGGQTYSPWQIYVATDSDCERFYNMSASHFPLNFVSDDQVLCTSYYSTLNPLENGQIYTSLVIGRPGAELFYMNESPRLQQWMKATNVRLRLEQMQILHNLINDNDDTANRRFFYSLRDIIVAGRCSCNGHASYCTQHNNGSVLCNCEGNTCGPNCDSCCPGYNVFPWQPSSAGQYFQCEECQCYGHSSECYYDSSAEGKSVDIAGNIRGGSVCTDCLDDTEGVNCERCKSGYYRGERESLYDKTCRACDCNTANIQLVEGVEFGSCNESAGGQCYCKEMFGGRQCEECSADHYNTADTGLHCVACNCHIHGTVSQLENCADVTGICLCKDNVLGEKCTSCRPETFNLTLDNDYGCSDCGCNLGGAENNNCDRETGQCLCKSGLAGRQCNQVAYTHYIPGPDFLAMEAEDGKMKGRAALYDFDENIFKDGFHGRGFATLNSNVPSVEMEVEIPEFTRYQVRMTYQLEEIFQKNTAYITAINHETGEEEQYEATLTDCVDGCDVTVQRCLDDVCEDINLLLTSGTYTIKFYYDAPAFNLDRIVLVPRNFEDPFIAHSDLHSCVLSKTTLCNEFQLPNLEPYIHKTAELDTDGTQFSVEDGGEHSLIFDFLYNGTQIEDLTVTVTDGTVEKTGYITLHYCDELQMCRAIIRDEKGQPLIYDSVPGNLTVTFDKDPHHPIEGTMYLVVHTEDLIYALKPQYICMRGTNGRCTLNTFPVAFPKTVRPGSKGYIITEEGEKITTEEYIEARSNYPSLTEICGSTGATYEVRLNLVAYPNTYLMIVEYFYTGLRELSVSMSFRDTKNIVGQGVVTFYPCNGYSACRTIVMNMEQSSDLFSTPLFRFDPRFVIASFVDFPVGKCILLNEIITTLGEGTSASALVTPVPLERTDEFLALCTPEDTSQFCEMGYLTMAAEFFGGLPECNCHPEGSLDVECEVYGGQCQCRDNVIGRTCDRCRAGYYGFPNCQPCSVARCAVAGSGFSSVCNEESGECECAPNVIGERCELCDADSYDYDDVLGCKDCDCNVAASSSSSCSDTGQCYCKNDTIIGDKCDTCVEGRTDFPACKLCGCDTSGSTGQFCDTLTGQCPCKEHATGTLCNECEAGYYNLEQNNTRGCEECFCFGVTQNCSSAQMAYYKIGQEFESDDAQGWIIMNEAKNMSMKPIIVESSEFPGLYELVAESLEVELLLKSKIFRWVAPFSGDLTTSYSGKLQFTLGFFQDQGMLPRERPRIDIIGRHGSIYRELASPVESGYTLYSVSLHEQDSWRLDSSGVLATKDDILTTLVNVTWITVKGFLTEELANYRLMSVSLDSAYPSPSGLITHLEECSCPTGYTGYSCQECEEGHYRILSSESLLGECVPCNCNGHSAQCDVTTGVCVECADNTYGDNCELCQGGYYGDPREGQSCQLCPCPLPLIGNVFGNCSYDPTIGGDLTCRCEEGYQGNNCEECAMGYYGNPRVVGGSCQQCSTCNNNTDTSADYCHATTGDCTLCLFNTAGVNCERCEDGYYGDAIAAKDCTSCQCYGPGTRDGTVCDDITGDCNCLSNIVGQNCDHCQPGYWSLPEDWKNATGANITYDLEMFPLMMRPDAAHIHVTFYTVEGEYVGEVEMKHLQDAIPKYRLFWSSDCSTASWTSFSSVPAVRSSNVWTLRKSSDNELAIHVGTEEVLSLELAESKFAQCQDIWSRDIATMTVKSASTLYKEYRAPGVGCVSCECNVNGTLDASCDQETGQCICHETVEGEQCNSCKDGYYGLSTLGHCTACDCNEFGSVSQVCDKASGQCVCEVGITGQQCDICDEWAIITESGCDVCTGCSRIVKDYIDELSGKIFNTVRLKETGGRVIEDIEILIEMKNAAILAKKEALDNIDAMERYEGILGTSYPLKSGSIRYQYNKLASYFDANVIDKLEETEDKLRPKEDQVDEVLELFVTRNQTYYETLSVLHQSRDMVDNIRIIAAEPQDIRNAITKSKNKLKKMKGRKIYQIDGTFINELATLNSSIYANLGSLVGTNLSDISSEITSVTVGMKAVLENAVASVLAPVNDFEITSNSITGDISNSMKTFQTRKTIIDDKAASLSSQLSSVGTVQRNFSLSQSRSTDLIADLQNNLFLDLNEATKRDYFFSEGMTWEYNKLVDSVAFQTEETCSSLQNFITAPGSPVQAIVSLQEFNNQTDDLEVTVSQLAEMSDEVLTEVNRWSTNNLQWKREELNVVNSVHMSLSSQIPTLSGKVTSDDLEGSLSSSAAANAVLKERLDDVSQQTFHEGSSRKKRYTSNYSVEEFTSLSNNLKKELKKIQKSNKKTQKVTDLISSTTSKISQLTRSGKEISSNVEDEIQPSLVGSSSRTSLSERIEQLKSTSSVSLSEKMRQLETKMSLIREKVKKTREAASTVQVGVKMMDYSYLKLPMPLVAEQSSRYTGISLLLKTEERSGTVLYLGSSISANMIHLELVSGRIQLQFDIGEGSTTVETNVPVNDGNWHKVRVSRNGKFGYVSVDNNLGETVSFSGAAAGNLDLLELDSEGYFFVGCSNSTAQSQAPRDMFRGSITQLRISNKPVGLWGYTESGGHLAPTQSIVSYTQFGDHPRSGLCMQGWGYAMYPATGIQINGENQIEIKLQTFDKDGLVFRLERENGVVPDVLDISLTGGQVILSSTAVRLTLLDTPQMTEDTFVSHGKMTTIGVQLIRKQATLSIDGNIAAEYKLSTTLNWEKGAKYVYVGGDNATSISGLVKSAVVDGIKLSLSQEDSLRYTGMSRGCLPSKALDGMSAFGAGYARYKPVIFTTEFRIDVRIRTSVPYGVILFASDALGFNAISLSVDDGQVEFVAMRKYAKTAVRTGQGVSDGSWHKVSIVRVNDTITLNLDGYTSSTMLRDNIEYPTTQGLYVAGVPPSIPLLLDVVPQLLPFEGAIRSFTIDGQILDLHDFVEAREISLAGTTIRNPERFYYTVE